MKENIEDIILAFLNHDIRPDDLKTLKIWLEESTQNKLIFEGYQNAWIKSAALDSHDFNKEVVYQQIIERITKEKKQKKEHFKTLHLRYISTIAASFLIGILISYFTLEKHLKIKEKKQDYAYTISVPQGSRMQLDLPDGSKVWLEAESKLSYLNSYGNHNREIFLRGEASFEVEKDTKKPFIVDAKEIKIKVLGTKFNVKNYDNDSSAYIWLKEGAILLSDQNNKYSIQLKPNEYASFNKTNGTIEICNYPYIHTKDWHHGTLIVDKKRFDEIAKEIKRIYNVDITFEKNHLKELRFYGNFSTDHYNAWQIIDILSTTNKFHYRYNINKNSFEIY